MYIGLIIEYVGSSSMVVLRVLFDFLKMMAFDFYNYLHFMYEKYVNKPLKV